MPERLGPLLKRLRRAKKISVRGLSLKMNMPGTSNVMIWRIEDCGHVPAPEVLERFAKLLGHRDEIFCAAEMLPPETKPALSDLMFFKFIKRMGAMSPEAREEIIWKVGGQLCQTPEKLEV